MSCNCKKIYAKRDIINQGGHYPKHICHMTYESLHDKSEIAAELAHRDIQIERLEAKLEAAEQTIEEISEFTDGWAREKMSMLMKARQKNTQAIINRGKV